jgi:small GTP-binding protein
MAQALIKQNLIPKELPYKPTAIIMGKTGAGKTTLANKLCGTTHRAGSARGSVTQQLYQNDVNCSTYAFALIDTPGTDSSKKSYKHAVLLREGLTATKVNTIFLVIKYESRFDKITENYLQLELPVSKYASKIVVIISFWDQSKDPKNDFKEICESFQEECPNVINIIFISDQCSNSEVANLMYSCVSNMQPQEIKITDEEFNLNFNTYEMKSAVKVSFEQYQRTAKQTEQEYTELIKSLQSVPAEERDEILHMCIVQFREEMESFLQIFQQQHASTMQELDWYTFHVKMQKENIKLCNEFADKVAPLMSYNLLDRADPRNLIKRCPKLSIDLV